MTADALERLRAEGYYSSGIPRRAFSLEEKLRYQKHGVDDPYRIVDPPARLFMTARYALEMQSHHSLLLCGLALERHRLKYGSLPETLDTLVPEFLADVPKDACDGQPLRYRRLPDEKPHVWTLWPSGKDDDGMPNRAPDKGNRVWTTGEIPGLTNSVYSKY